LAGNLYSREGVLSSMKSLSASIAVAAAMLVLVTGCGGSGWKVVSKGTYVPAIGHASVDIQATATEPSALGVEVKSTPTVKVLVSYSVTCGDGFAPAQGQAPLDLDAVKAGKLTAIPVPNGNPASCFVEILAVPTQDARVTVTILKR
jgi:hypothetical protein